MDNSTKIGVMATGALGIAGASMGNNAAKRVIQKKADEYISSRIEANIDNIHSSLKQSKWKDAFAKIVEKAKTDFPKACEKEIKNIKIKYVAGLAAAGLAIGTAITLIANKVKAKKAEKVETTKEPENAEKTESAEKTENVENAQ